MCVFLVFLLISSNILCMPVLLFAAPAVPIFLAIAFLTFFTNFQNKKLQQNREQVAVTVGAYFTYSRSVKEFYKCKTLESVCVEANHGQVHSACRGALNVVAKAGCQEGVRGVSYSLDI